MPKSFKLDTADEETVLEVSFDSLSSEFDHLIMDEMSHTYPLKEHKCEKGNYSDKRSLAIAFLLCNIR